MGEGRATTGEAGMGRWASEGRATTGEVRVVTVSDVGGLGGTDSSGEGDGGPGDFRGMPGW